MNSDLIVLTRLRCKQQKTMRAVQIKRPSSRPLYRDWLYNGHVINVDYDNHLFLLGGTGTKRERRTAAHRFSSR